MLSGVQEGSHVTNFYLVDNYLEDLKTVRKTENERNAAIRRTFIVHCIPVDNATCWNGYSQRHGGSFVRVYLNFK